MTLTVKFWQALFVCIGDIIQVHQTGSHIILDTEDRFHQRIAIPANKNLRIGTLNSILKSVAQHKQINLQRILDKL